MIVSLAVLLFFLVALCFGVVLLVGAPYLPTLSPQVAAAFKIADLPPGSTVLELGCGDGKVLIAAARAGYTAVGYELNPIMFAICWLRCRRYHGKIQVFWGDFWKKQWPPAEAIYVFLLPRLMSKLEQRIKKTHPGALVVSFAFAFPGQEPIKQQDGVMLYRFKNL